MPRLVTNQIRAASGRARAPPGRPLRWPGSEGSLELLSLPDLRRRHQTPPRPPAGVLVFLGWLVVAQTPRSARSWRGRGRSCHGCGRPRRSPAGQAPDCSGTATRPCTPVCGGFRFYQCAFYTVPVPSIRPAPLSCTPGSSVTLTPPLVICGLLMRTRAASRFKRSSIHARSKDV